MSSRLMVLARCPRRRELPRRRRRRVYFAAAHARRAAVDAGHAGNRCRAARTASKNLDLQAIYQQGKSDPNREGQEPHRRSARRTGFRISRGRPRRRRSTSTRTSIRRAPHLLDPVARCVVQSVPRAMYQGEFEIFQPPGYVVFLFARATSIASCRSTGAPPLGKDIQLYMGDSRARWEGNTLVITLEQLQQQDVVRHRRQLPQRGDARRGTPHARQRRRDRLPGHDYRSKDLHEAVDDCRRIATDQGKGIRNHRRGLSRG